MTEVQAPSIGSAELNYDPLGNRVRQILQEPYQGIYWLENVLNNVNRYSLETGATRRGIRLLVPDVDLMPESELSSFISKTMYSLEGAIKLSHRFEGFNLAYFSSNDPIRRSRPEILNAELDLISSLKERPSKTIQSIFTQAYNKGFKIEQIKGTVSAEDEERIQLMYAQSFRSYPFDIQSSIKDMIKNETSDVFVARYIGDSQIYAICATEELRLNISGRELVIREMGDSAKLHKSDSSKVDSDGLNAPLKLALIAKAINSDADTVFCETRAAWAPVNKINYDIGMKHSGFLNKHTCISGPETVRESTEDDEINRIYGNMNIWAVNRTQIVDIAAAVSRVL